MQRRRMSLLVASLLAFTVTFLGTNALAATPSFTITATDVTMSSNGSDGVGTSTTTLTSVNGYSGSVRVACNYPTLQAGVKAPYCGGAVAVPPVALNANQVVTGSIGFYTCSGMTCPVSLPRHRAYGLQPVLALAGTLLFGIGTRRRAARWLTLTLIAAGLLAGMAAIGACANNTAMTPGTYTYTVAATDVATNASVSSTFHVTVP